MASPPAEHRRDTTVIVGVVFLALAAACITSYIRVQDMRAEKVEEVARADAQADAKIDAQSVDWLTNCNPELNTFCPYSHHALDCLREHRAGLSTTCVQTLHNYDGIQPWRSVCAEDAYRLCPNQLAYDGKECLARHLSEVSAGCKTYYATQTASLN